MRIAVTGARGLIGWHAAARIHAQNCAARFRREEPPHELVQVDRALFEDADRLKTALAGVDAVLHFAGVNRAHPDEVRNGNRRIAAALVAALGAERPHIVYANSTHSRGDSDYGIGKREAAELLAGAADRFTDLVLPHIFGECARPDYNNVTATIIDRIWKGEEPVLNPEGRVQLLHAGEAAQIAIDAAINRTTGTIAPPGRDIGVIELYEKLRQFHALYAANIFPDLTDPFDLALFNAYRTAGYPTHYPKHLKLNSDARGTLFETAKGGNGAQTFMSSTVPGMKRGDHFHYGKVERFLVVKGKAVIRIRRVLTDEVNEFIVTGDAPAAIDMPPLHTHNIENIGDEEVLTLFWTHDMFDPKAPDTYADPV